MRKSLVIALASIALLFSLTAPPVGAPSPVALNAPVSITSYSVNLTWTQATEDGFASYAVYRSTTASNLGDLAGQNYNFTNTQAFIIDLEPGTTYYFAVRVVGADGSFADSNVVSAQTSPAEGAGTTESAGHGALIITMVAMLLGALGSIWGMTRVVERRQRGRHLP